MNNTVPLNIYNSNYDSVEWSLFAISELLSFVQKEYGLINRTRANQSNISFYIDSLKKHMKHLSSSFEKEKNFSTGVSEYRKTLRAYLLLNSLFKIESSYPIQSYKENILMNNCYPIMSEIWNSLPKQLVSKQDLWTTYICNGEDSEVVFALRDGSKPKNYAKLSDLYERLEKLEEGD